MIIIFSLNVISINIIMNDFDCVTNSIQLISKLHLPKDNNAFQHSFSKIIRQQAVTFKQQLQTDHQYNIKIKIKSNQNNYTPKYYKTEESKQNPQKYSISIHKQNDKEGYNFRKNSERVQKIQKINKKGDSIYNTEHKKANILIFDTNQEKQYKIINYSNKQKRDIQNILQPQKNKKYQNIYNPKQTSKSKKYQQQQATIKKQLLDFQQINNYNLQINSCQSSTYQSNIKDISKLNSKIYKNYSLIIDQTKQLINIIKYQHLENQKIQIRKNINKSQNQIRRLRIGCRGMSNLLANTETKYLENRSKLLPEQSDVKLSALKRKEEKTIAKVQPRQKPSSDKLKIQSNDHKGKSQIFLKQKLMKLQQQISQQKQKQQKLLKKYQQLQQRYSYIYKKYQKLQQKSTYNKRNGSIIKKNKLLNDKLNLLKQQIKQTKHFYSNKIKRNKNQNQLINNQIKFVCYSLEEIKTNNKFCQQQRDNNKQQIKKKKKNNLFITFQDENNINNLKIDSKIIPDKQFQLKNNFTSSKGIKAIKTFNTIKSTNCLNSKPSIGSLNSFKSTNIQQKSNDNKFPLTKGRLKISSPHQNVFPIKIHTDKKDQYTNKRQICNTNRQPRFCKQKKSSSLDIAFEELQKKYSKHLNTNEDNYDNYYCEKNENNALKFGSL